MLEISSSWAGSTWDTTEGMFFITETLSSFLLDKSAGREVTFFTVAIWIGFEFLRVLRAVVVLSPVSWNLSDRKFSQYICNSMLDLIKTPTRNYIYVLHLIVALI